MSNLLDIRLWESYPGQVCAYRDGDEEAPRKQAWGHSANEALAEFGLLVVERVDDHIYDLCEAGLIDSETANECFVDIDGLAYLPWVVKP